MSRPVTTYTVPTRITERPPPGAKSQKTNGTALGRSAIPLVSIHAASCAVIGKWAVKCDANTTRSSGLPVNVGFLFSCSTGCMQEPALAAEAVSRWKGGTASKAGGLRERATRLTTHFDGSGVLRRWEAASPRSMRRLRMEMDERLGGERRVGTR